MFIKNNIAYSEVYKYFHHKTRPVVCMTFSLDNFSLTDFEEVPMNLPLQVETEYGVVFWQNRLFSVIPAQLTYADIKTSIIKSRYSDDDQMALILNKDKSPEDLELFQKMQEWRDFAGYIAKDIISAE